MSIRVQPECQTVKSKTRLDLRAACAVMKTITRWNDASRGDNRILCNIMSYLPIWLHTKVFYSSHSR